jgi:hypothetical protein
MAGVLWRFWRSLSAFQWRSIPGGARKLKGDVLGERPGKAREKPRDKRCHRLRNVHGHPIFFC